MDVLPSGNIFHELQVVHDTGYYDGKVSPEEHWQQVGHSLILLKNTKEQIYSE
jgi:krueppel-like factor 6/7